MTTEKNQWIATPDVLYLNFRTDTIEDIYFLHPIDEVNAGIIITELLNDGFSLGVDLDVFWSIVYDIVDDNP